jgi:hypothetical protein
VEPWLNRAIAFAKGAGLLELVKGRNARLTPKGQETFELLRGADSVLAEEKAFLGSIAPKATERAVKRIMRMEPSL